MARSYTPRDAHTLMNALVEQATGAQSITVVDTSTFVSAGELVMSTGLENVYNALSILVGRTYAAVRPYDANLQLINAINSGVYTNRFRKISYYSKPAQPSGWFNTQLFTNLKDGFTAGQNPDAQGNHQSTKSQYEISGGVPLEVNFGGSSTWQESLTIFENQLKVAFRSEDECMAFWTGLITQKDNDIEMTKEAFNRMTLLNHMAARVDRRSCQPDCCIQCTFRYCVYLRTAADHVSDRLPCILCIRGKDQFSADEKEHSELSLDSDTGPGWCDL